MKKKESGNKVLAQFSLILEKTRYCSGFSVQRELGCCTAFSKISQNDDATQKLFN